MSRTAALLLVIASALMAGAMSAAVPWFIRQLPTDYFVRSRPDSSVAVKIARNIGGVVVVLLGIAMLVLPGQGVLTIVFGLGLLDFPAKHRALRWILHRRGIRSGMQRLRLKLGRPPLAIPPLSDGAGVPDAPA